MSNFPQSRRILARFAVVSILAVAGSSLKAAAGPSEILLRDYVHTSWTQYDGVPLGLITRIEQTSDGYLWLIVREGLLRFDGMRFVRPSTPCVRQAGNIARAADGGLWILCGDQLIRRTPTGQFVLGPQPVRDRSYTAILADRSGRVWLFSTTVQYLDPGESTWRVFPVPAESNLMPIEERDGTIWATDRERVFHLQRDRLEVVDTPGFRCATAASGGGLYVGASERIWHLRKGAPPAPVAAVPLASIVKCMTEAADGGLWFATHRNGVGRIKDGKVELLAEVANMDRQVADMLVDHDTVWVTNTSGLHRFSKPAVQVRRLLSEQGQPRFVFVDSHDRLWTGGSTRLRYRMLPADVEYSIVPDQQYYAIGEDEHGTVWLSTGDVAGYMENGKFVPVPDADGKPLANVYAFRRDRLGHLWALAQGVGVYRITPGPPRLMSAVREAMLRFLVSEHSGFWVGVAGGFEQHFSGRTNPFPNPDLQPSDRSPRTMIEDGGSIWVGSFSGLERVRNGQRTRWTREHGIPGDGAVKEIIADRFGYLWMMTGGGLLRLSRAQLEATSDGRPQPLSFARIGALDGVVPHGGNMAASPAVSADRSGRLYFTLQDAIAIVDPASIADSAMTPPIVLESVIVDNEPVDREAANRFVEPSRLQFEYTSLSLHSPELARFRHRLEGYDTGWIEAGAQRQVTYGTLPPGAYRFHVIGAGAEGVWNEIGASYAFHIAPVFWRTWWFQLSALAFGLAVAGGLYHLRVRQLTRRFNVGLEARISERTRIARELHDTLLQSFQGVLIHFQAARNLLPSRPDEAQDKLDVVLDQASQAITEGRDAVQALRESAGMSDNLPHALRALADQLTGDAGPGQIAPIEVNVEGSPRGLHPIVRDDVYRIASEAMRNAVRHARARAIQVDIHYDERSLQLRVRDDGTGIDAAVLDGRGVSGHWGLPGMRERAELIGGTLDVRGRLGAGTEVELSLPASKAYATVHRRRRSWSRR